MLIGKMITLRRIERGDLWRLWDWHELDELYLFKRGNLFISFDEISERFHDYFYGMMDFIIENESKPIGVCSSYKIAWKNRSCEITSKIYENDPDQFLHIDAISTFITFLFQDMNLYRIDSLVPEYDSSTIKVMHKIGFEMGGRFREHIYRDGCYKDILLFTLFNES